MMRSILLTAAISFGVAWSFPAFASCQGWRVKQCSQAIAKPTCMNRCVPACESKHGKTQ
jgi:hypothetical protein